MTMEEASPYINQSAVSAEDNVRCPRERFVMKAKAKAAGMETAANNKFQLRVFAPDRSHVPTTSNGIVDVRQRKPPLGYCP